LIHLFPVLVIEEPSTPSEKDYEVLYRDIWALGIFLASERASSDKKSQRRMLQTLREGTREE
jgi:hypothetical protein